MSEPENQASSGATDRSGGALESGFAGQPGNRPVEATPAVRQGAPQAPREVGGPKGPEPTRYGDWERGGRCIDF